MKKSLRPLLITAAVSALSWAALMGSCASKPPLTEPAAAPPPQAEPVAQPERSGGNPEKRLGRDEGQPAGGPAPGKSDSGGSGSMATALPPARGQTAEERRAAIDKRLNDSLGTFDAKLRIEQQKIAKERDGRQTAVTTVAASDSGSADTGNDGTDRRNAGVDSRSPRPSNSNSDRTAGDLKSDKGSSASAAGNGAVANEIPDGSDDDVIARRLRKAAEQETDPELKDKLWKEYVEYKKNMQGT